RLDMRRGRESLAVPFVFLSLVAPRFRRVVHQGRSVDGPGSFAFKKPTSADTISTKLVAPPDAQNVSLRASYLIQSCAARRMIDSLRVTASSAVFSKFSSRLQPRSATVPRRSLLSCSQSP